MINERGHRTQRTQYNQRLNNIDRCVLVFVFFFGLIDCLFLSFFNTHPRFKLQIEEWKNASLQGPGKEDNKCFPKENCRNGLS